jgi:ABC-type transporter MlaC component
VHTSSSGRTALTAALPFILLSFASLAQTTPVARIEALLSALQKVETPAAGSRDVDDDQRRANAATFARLDDFFDYDGLALAAIDGYQGRFSPEQMTRYLSTFRQVVRLVAFPSCADLLRHGTYRLAAGAQNALSADVVAMLDEPRSRVTTSIVFHLRRVRNAWHICDVGVAGRSLAADYREQFGRILQQAPTAQLLAKLDARLKTEEQRHLFTP